jgi:hypothetical protein
VGKTWQLVLAYSFSTISSRSPILLHSSRCGLVVSWLHCSEFLPSDTRTTDGI